MRLDRDAREFYTLTIATTPTVAAWEASFDGGTTWVAGTAAGGNWRWLVAGPDAVPGTATVLSRSTGPKIRAVDNPEIVVRSAPGVTLV